MSLRRVGGIAAIAAATFIMISCGQVYRPVVIPINITPPNSQNYHAVFAMNTNVEANPGTAMQIDVSGDSDIGQENMGISPTHMAILPNNNRVFVTSAGSLFAGESDVVTAFAPAADSRIATGLGPPTVFTYPNTSAGPSSPITAISESGSTVTVTLGTPGLTGAKVGSLVAIASVSIAGYNGTFPISTVSGTPVVTTITYQDPNTNLGTPIPSSTGLYGAASLPVSCSYLPDYVTTAQNSAVFVANYGVENATNCNLPSTDSVASLSTTTNAITNIQYLAPGSHPIAMVETPDLLNLYVLNQGNNTISDLSPVDLSTLATISVPASPLWAVARSDSHRVYVLTQDGTVLPIDPPTNTILPSATNLSVGAGANFILYDPSLNRLYVTNPGTLNPADAAIYIFQTTGGTDLSGNPNDTPSLLNVIHTNPGSALCPNGCSPSSVAALPNGERFYVASYANEATCSDPNVGSTACIIPMLTVFDALSMTAKTSSSTLLSPATSLSLLTTPLFSSTQYGVAPVAACAPPATYTPGVTRFRIFTAASADSSHVYVSMCDAGAVADVATNVTTIATGTNTPDTLKTDLLAPFGNCVTGCTSAAAITSLAIASNVVTFQAANNFTPGVRVSISNLTSAPGAPLNAQILTVLATGLSPTQFECNVTAPDVASTPDAGAAVPQSPPQKPTFLLTGQ